MLCYINNAPLHICDSKIQTNRHSNLNIKTDCHYSKIRLIGPLQNLDPLFDYLSPLLLPRMIQKNVTFHVFSKDNRLNKI